MASMNIRISPDNVRSVANQFKTNGERSRQMITELTNAVNNMHGEWEGMTQARFFTQFTEWQKAMNQFVTVLEGISTELNNTANTFEELDRKMGSIGPV